MGNHLLKLWIGCQFLLTAKGFKELPGCGLCGLMHYFYGIPQAERLSRAGIHACGTIGPIHTQVAFNRGLLFPACNFRGCYMDGAKGADHHAKPAAYAEPLVYRCVSLGAVGSACEADPYAGSVLALAALGGELDAIHLHHTIARLQSLAGQDCTDDCACFGMSCGTSQLTGMATHAMLGVNKDERTFY